MTILKPVHICIILMNKLNLLWDKQQCVKYDDESKCLKFLFDQAGFHRTSETKSIANLPTASILDSVMHVIILLYVSGCFYFLYIIRKRRIYIECIPIIILLDIFNRFLQISLFAFNAISIIAFCVFKISISMLEIFPDLQAFSLLTISMVDSQRHV